MFDVLRNNFAMILAISQWLGNKMEHRVNRMLCVQASALATRGFMNSFRWTHQLLFTHMFGMPQYLELMQ